MSFPDHPQFDRLSDMVRECLRFTSPWAGPAYRIADLEYASPEHLLNGRGSKRWGGRWNPPGFATTYLSGDPVTAMEEVLAHHRYYELPPETAFPLAIVSVRVRLPNALDLTTGTPKHLLREFENRIQDEDWRKLQRLGPPPTTHVIGFLLRVARLDGFLAPSQSRMGGTNLVLFPDPPRTEQLYEIVNSEKLGRLRTSDRRGPV